MNRNNDVIFCKKVRKLYPEFFSNRMIVEVGDPALYNAKRKLFRECPYSIVDISSGIRFEEKFAEINDVYKKMVYAKYRHQVDQPIYAIILTEALQPALPLITTLATMYDYLTPGGLVVITCSIDISIEKFASILTPSMFTAYHLSQSAAGLEFYGIKVIPTKEQVVVKSSERSIPEMELTV